MSVSGEAATPSSLLPMPDHGHDYTFDYCFTDKELQELLGVIEQKVAGDPCGGDVQLEGLEGLLGPTGQGQVPLQFQPREPSAGGAPTPVPLPATQLAPPAPLGAVTLKEEIAPSGVSSFSASPFSSPAGDQTLAHHAALGQQAAMLAQQMHQVMGVPQPQQPTIVPPPLQQQAVAQQASAALISPSLAQPSTSLQMPPSSAVSAPNLVGGAGSAQLPGVMPPPAISLARISSCGKSFASDIGTSQQAQQKVQMSHSTVEKQRRDRINSLIDELRELVPPQRGAGQRPVPGSTSDAPEARRPKHVVLADTIALLKALQTKINLNAPDQATSLLHNNRATDEAGPANSEGGSKGSSSQDEMMADAPGGTTVVSGGGAPQMPHIPCQLTQNSGVTVERGPDCLYVQVKCRDRKGLLSDIINSLKLLPLEIRTAAVTTTTDGTVRDVFEVRLDDKSLSPEDVQNMVHDALFQQHVVSYDHIIGKRQRAIA